jgi:hypothetical protein
MGSCWQGKTAGLSPHGVKVLLPTESICLPPDTRVQLRVLLPDQTLVSLTARVVRTEPDGLALEFVTLDEQQLRQLKEFVASAFMHEWQDLLNQFAPKRPLDANAGVPNTPLTPTEFVKGVTPAGEGVRANETGTPRPESAGDVKPLSPEQASATPSDAGSGQDSWQELLAAVGLGSLRLPTDGVLSPVWLEFLKQLERTRKAGPKRRRAKE